jgi:hypothetical protein
LKEYYRLDGRNHKTVTLTQSEIKQFLFALPVPQAKERVGRLSANWKRRRDRAMQCIVLGAGLTVSEAISLNINSIEKIRQIDGTLKIYVSDHSQLDQPRVHETFMHAELVPELLDWLNERNKLFPDNPIVFQVQQEKCWIRPLCIDKSEKLLKRLKLNCRGEEVGPCVILSLLKKLEQVLVMLS